MHLGEILDIQSPDILYVNHTNFFDIYWNKDEAGNLYVKHDLISSFKKYKLIIFDLGSEHFGDPSKNLILDVYKNLESHDLNFIVITHLPDQHNLLPRLKFCPNEYHVTRKYLKLPTELDLLSERKFLISCLNHSAWNHRIYNYVTLQEKSWSDRILFSVEFVEEEQPRKDNIQIPPEIANRWQILCQTRSSIFLGKGDRIWSVDHAGFLDAYAALITETVVLPGVYISEKTWKSIAMGQWFFMLGCPGTIEHLRYLGVDVFDDIIDHSYDKELDFFLRVEKLHQSIEKFLTLDHLGFWKDTASRRLSNQKKFLSGDIDNQHLLELRQIITEIETQ